MVFAFFVCGGVSFHSFVDLHLACQSFEQQNHDERIDDCLDHVFPFHVSVPTCLVDATPFHAP